MHYPQLALKPGRERRVLEGHPWVFSGAVGSYPDEAQPGDIVDVLDREGVFVARGYYNRASSIPVRILTRDPDQAVDAAFIHAMVERAYTLRTTMIDGETTNAYRLIHGESDGLPGLIVDRYADYLVVQFHTLGMEALKDMIVSALEEIVKPAGIYERSDVGTRRPEGLTTFPTGTIAGEDPPELIEILENDAKFYVDPYRGQKTGFFLDQRENRLTLQGISEGREVVNCFSYSGGFSVYAGRGGAKRVVSVDVSEAAVDLASKNLALNGIDPEANPCVAENVFDYLKACRSNGTTFDVVVIDPPAFVKNQNALKQATKAYISLNRLAIAVTRPGGMVVTASCSTQIDYEGFFNIVRHAAVAANRDVRIVKSHLQAVDHPAPATFPESRYLKCFFAVVD